MSKCKTCGDEHYLLLGCCDGRECGCMGQPVQMTNCPDCNINGTKNVGDYTKYYSDKVEYVGNYPGKPRNKLAQRV